MRRLFVLLLPAAVLGAVFTGGGCSSGHENVALDAGADTYGVHVGEGGGGSVDGGAEDGSGVTTSVRLAHAALTLGPVDYCWRTKGAASYVGPVLGGGVAPKVDASTPAEAGPVGDGGDAHGDDGGGDASASESEGGDDEASTGDDAGYPDASATDAAADAPLESTTTPLPDGAAPPNSLVFGGMTPTLVLPASGTFDLALVRAGQTSCASPELTGQVTLDAGKSATVVIMGVLSPNAVPSPLTLVAFTDDARAPGSAEVRMIHAALGTLSDPGAPSLSVTLGSDLVALDVDPGGVSVVSALPPVDALGYTTLDAVGGATAIALTAVKDASPATWKTAATNLGVAAGSLHTGIIVSLDQGSLGVMWCADASDPTGDTPCTVLPASR